MIVCVRFFFSVVVVVVQALISIECVCVRGKRDEKNVKSASRIYSNIQRADVPKAIRVLKYYEMESLVILQDQIVHTHTHKSLTDRSIGHRRYMNGSFNLKDKMMLCFRDFL